MKYASLVVVFALLVVAGCSSGMDMHEEMHHEHLMVQEPYPSVAIEVLKDPKSGWNVHLMTENFRFSPENASREHVAGEGHAHIYVDGVKVNRVYSDWYHISSLEKGTREISVSLNANTHANLMTPEGELYAYATVVVE